MPTPNCKCGHEKWAHHQVTGRCMASDYEIIERIEDVYRGFPRVSLKLEYKPQCTCIMQL